MKAKDFKRLRLRKVPSSCVIESNRLIIQVPCVVEGNANSRRHWALVSRERSELRSAVNVVLSAAWKSKNEIRRWGGWRVTVTRQAPRELDSHDNLRMVLKGVIDEVTLWLGLRSDSDERLKFEYAQTYVAPLTYGILVEIARV